MTGNAAELLNLSLRHRRRAPCTPFRGWLKGGFGVALVWLWYGFGVALVWPWGGLGVALVWLWRGFVLRSLCLVYAYNMALGWLWVA